jgi:hypothetical protein
MKHHITSILFVFLSTIAFSQSIERQVIGSSGFSTSNTAAQISFTLGETVIFSGIQSNSTITQGFQQAEEEDFVSVMKPLDNSNSIIVYPIPAENTLTIKSDLGYYGHINYKIIDLQGRIILFGNLQDANSTIDISTIANASYTLLLTSPEKRINQKVKFVKL